MRPRIIVLIVFALAVGVIYAQPLSANNGVLSAQAAGTPQRQVQTQQPPAEATIAELEARGDELRSQKAYEQALVYYQAALRKDKKNVVILNKAGIADLQLNDSRAAQRYFEQAIKHNRRYPEAHNNLGVAYYVQRNYKKAIRQYEKALQLREDSASFHSNLGTAWFARHRVDKAMAEYARALELDQDVLMRSSQGGVAAQISSPEDRAYYSYVLAKMYAKRGDIDRCLQCLRKAKEEGYSHIKNVYEEAEFVTIRTDPRFAELLIPRPH